MCGTFPTRTAHQKFRPKLDQVPDISELEKNRLGEDYDSAGDPTAVRNTVNNEANTQPVQKQRAARRARRAVSATSSSSSSSTSSSSAATESAQRSPSAGRGNSSASSSQLPGSPFEAKSRACATKIDQEGNRATKTQKKNARARCAWM